MTAFVLVHGAWHGGWCWQRLTPLLERAGHPAHTPTLTGLAERAGELTPEVGLQDHVDDILRTIDRADGPVILVGHSYAGLVVREAARIAADRVGEIVLVEGWIGPGGRSLLDLAPEWFADGIRHAAQSQGDGWRIPAPEPAAVGVQDPDDATWLRRHLTEHPLKTFTDPTGDDAGLPPMRAIVATPGPVPFTEMAATLDLPTLRIDGGHDLMITSPRELADALMAPDGSLSR
jgi:pimeloyl-ACP methyl ester carboxylesterase